MLGLNFSSPLPRPIKRSKPSPPDGTLKFRFLGVGPDCHHEVKGRESMSPKTFPISNSFFVYTAFGLYIYFNP